MEKLTIRLRKNITSLKYVMRTEQISVRFLNNAMQLTRDRNILYLAIILWKVKKKKKNIARNSNSWTRLMIRKIKIYHGRKLYYVIKY